MTNTCLFHSVEMQFQTHTADVALEWFTRLIHIHELRVQFTVCRMAIFSKAFRAFGQYFPAKTELQGKGKPVSVRAYYKLRVFQEVEAPKLQDCQHMKVVRL